MLQELKTEYVAEGLKFNEEDDWDTDKFFCSLTAEKLLCSDNPDELVGWAKANKIKSLSTCRTCLNNGYASIKSRPFIWTDKFPFDHIPLALQGKVKAGHLTRLQMAVLGGIQLDEPVSDSALTQELDLVVEGIAKETFSISRSRSKKLRGQALARAKGACEACGVDFSLVLEGMGNRALQVHHQFQLSLNDEPKLTSVEDLAVVCANCHAMIHTDLKNAIPVQTLRAMWEKSRSHRRAQ